MPTDEKLGYDRVLFEIRVIESLRGMEKVGDVVNIRTGFGGGDCGYRFKIGGKYLIDASKSEGAFLTGICSLTAPLENSEVELRSLRRLAARQRAAPFYPSLFGWYAPPSLLGGRSRRSHGINYTLYPQENIFS